MSLKNISLLSLFSQLDHAPSILDDIKTNLERLLNTRKRPWCSYGLPDFSRMHSDYTEAEICRLVKEVIEHSEPRMSQISVAFSDDPITSYSIYLKITAKIIQCDSSILLNPFIDLCSQKVFFNHD